MPMIHLMLTTRPPSPTRVLSLSQLAGQVARLLYAAAIELGQHGPDAPGWTALSPLEQSHYYTRAETAIIDLDLHSRAQADLTTIERVLHTLKTRQDDASFDTLIRDAARMTLAEQPEQLHDAWRRARQGRL